MRTIYFIHKNSKLIIIATVLLLIGIFMISSLSSNSKEASASTTNVKYFTCIVIEQGDTLYDIAATYMSEEYESAEEYIAEVKSINNLYSDDIMSGASLVVPYYAEPSQLAAN